MEGWLVKALWCRPLAVFSSSLYYTLQTQNLYRLRHTCYLNQSLNRKVQISSHIPQGIHVGQGDGLRQKQVVRIQWPGRPRRQGLCLAVCGDWHVENVFCRMGRVPRNRQTHWHLLSSCLFPTKTSKWTQGLLQSPRIWETQPQRALSIHRAQKREAEPSKLRTGPPQGEGKGFWSGKRTLSALSESPERGFEFRADVLQGSMMTFWAGYEDGPFVILFRKNPL